jgi:hypothetical protein
MTIKKPPFIEHHGQRTGKVGNEDDSGSETRSEIKVPITPKFYLIERT